MGTRAIIQGADLSRGRRYLHRIDCDPYWFDQDLVRPWGWDLEVMDEFGLGANVFKDDTLHEDGG